MILLWLDDVRDPRAHAPKFEGDIVWVKSYAEFDAYMQNNPMPDMISFDYMLGTGEDMFTDGIGCAKSVIRKCDRESVNFPRYRIHSTFDSVSKLRKYIEHAIDMYELGDAVEEDRVKNTPEQDKFEGVKTGTTGSALQFSGSYTKIVDAIKLPAPIPRNKRLGRNEICNCGSGKKFKHCHGKH